MSVNALNLLNKMVFRLCGAIVSSLLVKHYRITVNASYVYIGMLVKL